jgi:hypothetical protein
MPGPVSDSYDPEWGTADNRDMIDCSLKDVYDTVSVVLGNRRPLQILQLVGLELETPITARMTEKEWRLVRFALERARDSL